MRSEFTDQVQPALAAQWIRRHNVRLGEQYGVREGEFAHQEFAWRPLVFRRGGEA